MTNQNAFDAAAPYSFVQFVQRLFSADFMPHGHCFFWRKDLLWLHVFSDAVITVSYYAIPVLLIYFAFKRKDFAFHWIFLMFGIFILACGTTHLMAIVTMWNGAYRIEGLIKLITALASIITAIVLIPLMPKLMALPTQSNLYIDLQRKSQDLIRANAELEQFNNAALGREDRVIELKQEVNELLEKLGKSKKYEISG